MSKVVEYYKESSSETKTKDYFNLEGSKNDCQKAHEKKQVKNYKEQYFDKSKRETNAEFANANVD